MFIVSTFHVDANTQTFAEAYIIGNAIQLWDVLWLQIQAVEIFCHCHPDPVVKWLFCSFNLN